MTTTAAAAVRTLRPLRSCPSPLRSLRGTPATTTPPSARRAVSYWKPSPGANAAAASTRTAASKTAAASPRAYKAPVASKAATPPAAPAAAQAAVPEPPAQPVVLDPQAAIPPAPEATATSGFAPVPEPSPFASTSSSSSSPLTSLNGGSTGDAPGAATIDWSASFHGLGQTPFSPETAAILMAPLDPEDVEVKPDGIIYLPEIKYRRILNRAFGPGGWGLAPRGDLIVGEKVVTREYALVAHGRFVGQARGECQYFSDETIPTAGEGCKSNALMRCCKDLGIGSELWDPRFIRTFKKKYAQEVWVEHVVNKKKRQIWMRKDGEVGYPYKRT